MRERKGNIIEWGCVKCIECNLNGADAINAIACEVQKGMRKMILF